VTATTTRPVGRPRNPELDRAILAAAEQQLGELGYTRMSLESVAAAAGTTVPSVRRRFGSKAALAQAVIKSLRVADLPAPDGPPRARALAILENFHRNLLRDNAMAVLGTLLAEERRHPGLLETFRTRLAGPRRALLHQALADGITAGELPGSADPDVLANLLIGSFYARYIATSELPQNWPHRALGSVWPDQPPGTHASPLPSESGDAVLTAGDTIRETWIGPLDALLPPDLARGALARPGAIGLLRGFCLVCGVAAGPRDAGLGYGARTIAAGRPGWPRK
jgi:AcrR family transcriptional regulator